MNILITGCAGFIGYHTCKKFLDNTKHCIFGVDNLNTYYDVKLKRDRLKLLKHKNFNFKKLDISDLNKLNNFVKKIKVSIIINLAAQAGVRFSIKNTEAYFLSNIKGFYNILEVTKRNKVSHLIYASTSSVYGDTNVFPTPEKTNTDKPKSFYAASKKTNEILAFSYSSIYNIRTTGLRFFTVYGPYGRPDMAIYKFADAIKNKKYLNLYNSGNHYRDFTFVDDVVDSIIRISLINDLKHSNDNVPARIFNIGNSKSEKITKIINIIENYFGIKAKLRFMKMQKGDVIKTHSNTTKLFKFVKKNRGTSLKKGLLTYLDWFIRYYD